MDMNKLREWIELSQSHQASQFWQQVFSQNHGPGSQTGTHTSSQYIQRTAEWPIYDMYVNGDRIYITVEVPGIAKEDIQISVHEKTLTINGSFKTFSEGIHYYVKERRHQTFSRQIEMPDAIEKHKIQTVLQNGLLIMSFPIETDDIPSI
ncbi:Hsp20/alpha crystallin family protein [Peribacillus sp. SCS-155]|uniref:Hsp20/alpha crystallin family protein n=1 Tax=Peribacillus sedimenti TaxID=3115297 RepID=UPI003905E639